MGWKIIFAPQALDELEQIVGFIAQDDPAAAIRFGDYLVDRAESLTKFPDPLSHFDQGLAESRIFHRRRDYSAVEHDHRTVR
jgi:plasmid stabilization system protein ParE